MPFFFFNDTATTEIYTLSLHDALPIYSAAAPEPPAAKIRPARADALPWLVEAVRAASERAAARANLCGRRLDRKSTRLNSSHVRISYAVFCFEKKKHNNRHATRCRLTH